MQFVTIGKALKDFSLSEKALFRMAGRKRTRSENKETKTHESPMKNPPIVKVGLIIRPLCPGDITLLRFI